MPASTLVPLKTETETETEMEMEMEIEIRKRNGHQSVDLYSVFPVSNSVSNFHFCLCRCRFLLTMTCDLATISIIMPCEAHLGIDTTACIRMRVMWGVN